LKRFVADNMNEVHGHAAIEIRLIRVSRQSNDRRSSPHNHLIGMTNVKRLAIGQLDSEWLKRL